MEHCRLMSPRKGAVGSLALKLDNLSAMTGNVVVADGCVGSPMWTICRQGRLLSAFSCLSSQLSFSWRLFSLLVEYRLSVDCNPCCEFVNDVKWRIRWSTVAFFRELQYGLVLIWIHLCNLSVNIPLRTY